MSDALKRQCRTARMHGFWNWLTWAWIPAGPLPVFEISLHFFNIRCYYCLSYRLVVISMRTFVQNSSLRTQYMVLASSVPPSFRADVWGLRVCAPRCPTDSRVWLWGAAGSRASVPMTCSAYPRACGSCALCLPRVATPPPRHSWSSAPSLWLLGCNAAPSSFSAEPASSHSSGLQRHTSNVFQFNFSLFFSGSIISALLTFPHSF